MPHSGIFRLRGQSIIEYVLIVAIIGLVVVFAGPQVAGAIRNQFNTVTETLDEGTSGVAFKDPADIPDPKRGTAFAVYSEDDHSLLFYKRRGVPKVGDMFNDRRVTEVYIGFEESSYTLLGYDQTVNNWGTCETDTPWSGIRDSVTKINVVDSGIAPKSITVWFYRFSNLEVADLSNLDSTRIMSVKLLFLLCSKLSQIKMPRLTNACTNCQDAFAYCGELVSLELPPSDFSNCRRFYHMFIASRKLTFDCSDWNVQTNADHDKFNDGAPGVILPKAWQND